MNNRRWSRVLIGVIWGILWLVSSAIVPAQNEEATDVEDPVTGIDIVFAIDTTTSMTREITRTTMSDQEIGMRLWRDQNLLPAGEQDRNNLSFDTTNFINEWLADFIETQATRYGAIDISTTLIAFDQTPTTIYDEQSLASGAPETRIPNVSGERSADFLNLYDDLAQIFPESNNDRRRAVFVITDSMPCNPDATAEDLLAGRFVRERFCEDLLRMATHVELATEQLPPDVEQYIYFLGASSIWTATGTTGVRDQWESAADRSEGAFQQITDIDELPSTVFGDVLDLLTRALIGGRVDNSAEIGVFERAGAIPVPPYQEFMDVILFLDENNNLPRFASPDGDNVRGEPLASSDTGQLQRLRFDVPTAGEWRLQGYSGNVWVSFKPTTATVAIERVDGTAPTDLYQFEQVRVTYALTTDEGGDGLVDLDNVPDFSLTVLPDSGADFALTMSPGAGRFISDPLLLSDAGRYRFTFDVEPTWDDEFAVDTEASADVGAFNFLTPVNSLSSIDASPLSFEATLGTDDQQQSLAQSNTITISRSQQVPLQVTAQVAGETVAVPDGALASLNLTGAGCLTAPDFVVQNGAFIIPGGGLNFEAGECDVALTITYTSPEAPVADDILTLVAARPLGTVTATETARLEVLLRDRDGDYIDQDSFDPAEVLNQETASVIHYRMQDVLSQPTINIAPDVNPTQWVTWDADELNIDVVFRDSDSETLDLVDPEFMQATDIADAPASDDEVREDFPVPFEVSVVRLGTAEDITETNDDIRMVKSGQNGVYTLQLADLEAGDYQIRFELLRDEPEFQLDPDFEYSEDVLNTQSVGNPRLYAFLRVQENRAPLTQQGAFAVLVLAIVLYIMYRIVRAIIRTRGALSGQLLIYKGDPSSGTPKLVWQSDLPPNKNNLNFHKFSGSDLTNPDTLGLNPDGLRVFTGGDTDLAAEGGAKVLLQLADNTDDYRLAPNVPQKIAPSYYIVKLADNTSQPDWTNVKE